MAFGSGYGFHIEAATMFYDDVFPSQKSGIMFCCWAKLFGVSRYVVQYRGQVYEGHVWVCACLLNFLFVAVASLGGLLLLSLLSAWMFGIGLPHPGSAEQTCLRGFA